jgi:multidrug transporter EmrE-like cation transporter
MSATVFFAILFAAALHAGWNALVKTGLDRFSAILFLGIVQGAIALVLLPFFGLPVQAAWPWVLAGSALHGGYKFALIRAYGHGDLSQIYPLSRGTAPLIVAAAGASFFGESMDLARSAAVVAIAAGIMLMAGRGGLNRAGLFWALVTASFTAAYTLPTESGRGSRARPRPSS